MTEIPLHRPPFPPVGCCIYCRATPPSKLTDEHVIPYSLNGDLILPQSSCLECNEKTKSLEGAVGRQMWNYLRVWLSIQSRNPQDRPKTIPFTTRSAGRERTIELPPDGYPMMYLFWDFGPPDILGGQRWKGVESLRVFGFIPSDELAPPGVNWLGPDSGPSAMVISRLVAKIAHGYACAVVGVDCFTPFLLRLIREKPNDETEKIAFEYVGGLAPAPGPSADAGLHVLAIRVEIVNNRPLVIADVRLFASLNAPVYVVVVGELIVPITSIKASTHRR